MKTLQNGYKSIGVNNKLRQKVGRLKFNLDCFGSFNKRKSAKDKFIEMGIIS